MPRRTPHLTIFCLIATSASCVTDGAAHAQDAAPLRPVIMEIMYDVPPREVGGDANKDALRHPVGDEFVEIYNPHDEPVDLTGYRIQDEKLGVHQLVFTFPEFTLPPGEIVVVFNGARADEIPNHDGGPEGAPAERNPHFGNSWVFSMRQPTAHLSFTNKGDVIGLWTPDDICVEVIWWGELAGNLPSAERTEQLTASMATVRPLDAIGMSMQRLTPDSAFTPHAEIDGKFFSPGVIPTPQAVAPEKTDDNQGA